MKRIVTSLQMKYMDEKTIMRHQMDSMVLMERAALSVVKQIEALESEHVLVVCGSGNNGGDGIAIARILFLKGKHADIYFIGNSSSMSSGCRRQMEIAESYGMELVQNPDYSEYDTIVDAIFGVGLSRRIDGAYAEVIDNINQSKTTILSVDMPSGVNADDGKILGIAVEADITVTFAYQKVGQLLYPGKKYCGKLITEDIGIYDKKNRENGCSNTIFEKQFAACSKEDLSLIPQRCEEGNKGSFGKVFLIAGSCDMPGASILCGKTIMRMGSGMLKMLIPKENREIISTAVPEAMLSVYDSAKQAIAMIEQAFLWADVVAVGPGLGQEKTAGAIVEYVVKNCKLPLVLDADAINIISKQSSYDAAYPAKIKNSWLSSLKTSCIITPHIGEMARLTVRKISDIKESPLAALDEFCNQFPIQCVLKDSVTCIGLPDKKFFINQTGNCGMATAGSGDVLTGMIAGLLSIGVKWELAGALGAWLHGAAGDCVKEQKGTASMMAGDLIQAIAAFRIGEIGGNTIE